MIKCKDHTGRRFASFSAMCWYWGKTPVTVKKRLADGLSLAEALTITHSANVPARDHQGRDYISLAAMAAAWGIVYGTFYRRLIRGWSIKRALTQKVKRKKRQLDEQKNNRL